MSENSSEFWIPIIAGSCTGIVVKTLTAPIDRIRIIYQTNKFPFTFKYGKATANRIIKEEGWKTLFRGNQASVLRVVPYFSLQFVLNEQLKSALCVRTYEQKRDNPGLSIATGAISSFIAIGCTYPLDVARARLATDTSYKSLYSVFRRAVTSKQTRYGLYRGFSSATLAVIPYSAITFHLYELVRMKYSSDINLNPFVTK